MVKPPGDTVSEIPNSPEQKGRQGEAVPALQTPQQQSDTLIGK